MLDKIRLNAQGALPPEYQANMGEGKPTFFDGRCCRFLSVPYVALKARALEGGCDEEVLSWAEARGARRTDEECLIWNSFVTKLGWRDERSVHLLERTVEFGLRQGQAETMCELIDIDEGRAPGGTRWWEARPPSVVIMMGVSGCGKTTVGRGLADALGWDFLEADELHSTENIARMSAGIPLTDAERAPWIEAVRAHVDAVVARRARVVVACSALKEAYRRVLTPDPADTRYVLLRGDYGLIKGRLEKRTGHFMKENLLSSQFEALEPPLYALTLDAALHADVCVDKIRNILGLS